MRVGHQRCEHGDAPGAGNPGQQLTWHACGWVLPMTGWRLAERLLGRGWRCGPAALATAETSSAAAAAAAAAAATPGLLSGLPEGGSGLEGDLDGE